MSHGVAPVNEDTIRQVKELLNPLPPRPMWTDTRPTPTSRARIPAQIDITKLGGPLKATPRRTAADIYGWNYEHLQTLIGGKEATEAMGRFLNHILGGRLIQETQEDMTMVKVTPLLKGTTGKVRPITVGATLKRRGLSAVLRNETNLKDVVGQTEYATGRKSAIEDLNKDIDAAIDKIKQSSSNFIAPAPSIAPLDKWP